MTIASDNSNGEGSFRFRALDFADTGSIAQKLGQQGNPLHQYLFNRLSDPAKLTLCNFTGTRRKGNNLIGVLIPEFDQIVAGELIYNADRFTGIELRKKTRDALRDEPDQTRKLNRLLLEDVFAEELWYDVSREVFETKEQGHCFSIRREVKVLITKVSVKYRIYFTTPNGLESRQLPSLDEAKGMIPTLAAKVLAGDKPLTKEVERELKAKAQAYDQIAKKLSKLQLADLEAILDALEEFVAARLRLGLSRSLLDFVIRAVHRLEKDVIPTRLSVAGSRYKDFVKHKDVAQPTKNFAIADAMQFIKAAPDIMIERESKEGAEGLSIARRETLMDPWMTEILSNDIQQWMENSAVHWCSRKHKRAHAVTFLNYARDVLHALPANMKTAAQLTPVPNPPSEEVEEAVSVLEPAAVWCLILNLQDLESLFFVALAVFAGLHHREIWRLDWKDVIWDGKRGVEVKVSPGKGKNRRHKRKARFISARGPLAAILRLGKGRTGRIIKKYGIMRKIKHVARRLGIKWSGSILRHTFASCRLGSGVNINDVATEMGTKVCTVEAWYIEPTPRQQARWLWIAPINIERFRKLPDWLVAWDWDASLKRARGATVKTEKFAEPQAEPPHSVSEPSESPRAMLQRLRKSDQPQGNWPPNLKFLVMVWDKSQTELRPEWGYSQRAVSLRIKLLRIPHPNDAYWRNKRAGLPVKVPNVVLLARKLLQREMNSNQDVICAAQ